ncbi:MAG: Ldh family oxidoreductase [Candidatus Zophobacter franzmannii]|nr:Ldh family oxidoreductase [Candidatus Zophobacter franzmannii]
MLYLPVETLYNFMQEVFIKVGVPAEEAKICADVLIESDLRGIESHGIGRLKMYYDRIKAGIQFTNTKIDVVSDRAATAVWDGNHGMGHVIAHKAMQNAIDKAKQFGIGCVTVRNSTHYGICGYYASMAIEENMIGFTFTNARPSIAPTNGVEPMLGTNPICFGCPADGDFPFIYDAATSISQRGKIEVLAREEKATPEGWAINLKGETQTDTAKLLVDLVKKQASMLPIGGTDEVTGSHKGYGLSMMVEILSAALQNGSYLQGLHGWAPDGITRVPYKLGHFFLAINIDFFTDIKDFKSIVGDIMKQMVNSKKIPGRDRIYVAGEKEHFNAIRVKRDGIPVVPNLRKDIEVMQKELGIDMIQFD